MPLAPPERRPRALVEIVGRVACLGDGPCLFIWRGGESHWIAPDASGIEELASTGGFTLGMAVDPEGRLDTCAIGHKAVFPLDPSTRQLDRYSNGGDGGSFRIGQTAMPTKHCPLVPSAMLGWSSRQVPRRWWLWRKVGGRY
jgi:hypothetical protein